MGEFRVCVRWCGDRHELSLSTRSTVLDLKKLLADKTGVPCHRQRLVGLLGPLGVAPSSIGDETKLSEVRIGSGDTIMMIGSSEPPAKMPKCASAGQTTQERASPKERDAPGALEENYRKIESRIRTYRFEQLAEPRKGKKLLVLDIDYTLFECRSCVGNASESTRPHLHEFLAAVYRHYDIFIWSATSLKTVRLKVEMMDMLSNEEYRICALMDQRAMITMYDPKYGGVFGSKPLQLIWSRYADFYGPHNTIMVDDAKRNFVTSPQNGLKISAFRRGAAGRDADAELAELERYVLAIAELDDFTHLKHKNWKRYLNIK